MPLTLVTPPATEPLTTAEVKAHLRLDSSNGEPAPTVLTVALAGLGAGNVNTGAHRYLATFVTADGETDAGIISAAVTTSGGNGQVAVLAIPIGGSAVTARKLYRTAAGGSTYLLLATISDNTTTTYADNIADASLGAQAPTTNTTADPELVGWISAARQYCESFTHRAFVTQTWDYAFDDFPRWNFVIDIPKPPLVSVTSVSYVDQNGTTQVWTQSGNYTVDTPSGPEARMGRVIPGYNIPYPVTRAISNAVTIRFVAGYGAAAAVPYGIKAAMKLLIGNWFLNREAGQIIRGSADVLPFGVEALLWPFKAF